MAASALRRRYREAYLVRQRGLLPTTVRAYDYGLDLVERFTRLPIEEVSTQDSLRYLQESEDSPNQKHLAVAAMKSFDKFESLVYDRPPSAKQALSAPRIRRDNKGTITREEAGVLIAEARTPVEIRGVYLPLFAGLRRAECIAVDGWEDRLLIGQAAKGRKPREIPVHPQLDRVKDAMLSESPTYSAIAYHAEKMSARLDITFSLHPLRARFARNLDEADVEERVRNQLMGHDATIGTVYAGHNWRKKSEAIKRVEYPVVRLGAGYQMKLF